MPVGRGAVAILVLAGLTLWPVGPAWTAGSHTAAPSGLGGFILGEPADTQANRLRMDMAAPMPYARYVLSVPAVPPPGFSNADAGLADCDGTGRLLRLRLVFTNGNRDFFDRLLKEYKKRYGEPDQWRGDPFHLVLAWKWTFENDRGERLSLVLTHSDDEEAGRGNSVKLTNWTLWERERACYERSHPPHDSARGSVRGQAHGQDRHGPPAPEEDLTRFLPQ